MTDKDIDSLRILRKALELAARDSCEYDCGGSINNKTLQYIVANYLQKAQKLLDKSG
jgi:hypothetical protein